jgi:hypothetical protein
MPTLNLTKAEIKQAQGNNFETLPAGVYGASIYTSEQKLSKAKNDMYQIDFKIKGGPTGIGRRVRGWFVLAPNALFKLIELNKAVGFPYPTKDTPEGEFEFPEAEEYLSEEVNIVLEVQEYPSVATSFDVENGTLNAETGEPVTEEGEPVTKTQNNIKRVLAYDEDKWSTEDDVADSNSGLFL